MVGTTDTNLHYVTVFRTLKDHWVEYSDLLVSEYRARERTVTEGIHMALYEQAEK
jgi:hypothetical protein